MATLGTAYVQIVPSAQGISGKIQKVLDPEAKIAGSTAGKNISSTIGSGLKTVGSGLTKYVTKPVLAAGGALSGLTLAKGWARMTEIDNARVKIEALGKDFGTLKTAANDAVEGTAFKLNTALTTAASAAAAGIKEADMTGYLKSVANAAAFAGTDMDEMGQIFNKVAAKGKMSGEELQQLSERGVPAVQLLSEATGKSMEEVQAAISNGEIGIEDLQKAFMTLGEDFAQNMGEKTITGALSNIGAAFGRIGANIIGESDKVGTIASKILPLLKAFKDALKPIEEKSKEIGAAIAAYIGPAIDRITNMLSGGGTVAEKAQAAADRATAKFAAFGTAIAAAMGPAVLIISKGISLFGSFKAQIAQLAANLGTTSSHIMKVGGIVGILVAAFAIAYTKSESFRTAINQLATLIGGALMQIFQALTPLLQMAAGLFIQLATAAGNILGPILQALMPIIEGVVKLFVNIITVQVSWLTTVLGSVSKLASVPNTIRNIFEKVKQAITAKLNAARNGVSKVVSKVRSFLSFSGLAGKVQAAFNKIKEKITTPIETAKNKVKGIIDKIKGLFPLSVGKIFSNIKIPSISVSGGKAPFGIGGLGTKPKISISWHKKAMENPYLFSNATLFGAGEAGDEMLYGRRALMSDIADVVDGNGNGGDVIVNFNYDASDDANDMMRDLARGVRRLKMAGVI